MENLKALVSGRQLTVYQRALAKKEFEGIVERLELYDNAVKNNTVLSHVSNLLIDLDGKTIPVTFHVSKFKPKIYIDLIDDC